MIESCRICSRDSNSRALSFNMTNFTSKMLKSAILCLKNLCQISLERVYCLHPRLNCGTDMQHYFVILMVNLMNNSFQVQLNFGTLDAQEAMSKIKHLLSKFTKNKRIFSVKLEFPRDPLQKSTLSKELVSFNINLADYSRSY